MLVCRALSNILLLPWPNLPENEQQWPVRSINHASLISALSRDYRDLKPSAAAPQRKMPLDDSKCPRAGDGPGRQVGQALSSFVADEAFVHLSVVPQLQSGRASLRRQKPLLCGIL